MILATGMDGAARVDRVIGLEDNAVSSGHAGEECEDAERLHACCEVIMMDSGGKSVSAERALKTFSRRQGPCLERRLVPPA